MPPGSKKRKALKKKKEQEAIGNSTNITSFNGHGHDKHGSQVEIESDGNLSSPGSQGNGEFWTRDLSPSPLSGLVKVTATEKTEDADVTRGHGGKSEDVIAVGREKDHEENGVDKPSNSFPANLSHNAGKSASPLADSIPPVVDLVKPVGSYTSEVVISDKNEQVESSTVKQKFDENEEKHILKEAKEGNSSGSLAETNKDFKTVKGSEVPECSKDESIIPSAPPVVRTSWLSCCGLFDVMAGSER